MAEKPSPHNLPLANSQSPDCEPIYPSRIDGWLAVILIAGLAMAMTQGILLYHISPIPAMVSITVVLAIAGIIAACLLPCRYYLCDDHLLIRSGLLRHRIPYNNITAIALSSSPLSAPALSLKRIRIDHSQGFILISPIHREEFLAILQQRVKKQAAYSPDYPNR